MTYADPTVFLDIETTGLDPACDQILEVAMRGDSYFHFALSINEQAADAKALEVNRYFERCDELEAITVSEQQALGYFLRGLTGKVVVGNNVQFDLRFIETFLRRWWCGRNSTPWHYHPVDLKALVAGKYGLGPAPWSTKQIADAVGVPLPDDAHSAVADCEWNRAVYAKVTS